MGFTKAAAAMAMIASCTMLLLLGVVCEGEGCSLKLRRQQVSLYVHDTLNVTDIIVLNGPNFRPITPVDSSFGTASVFNDLVTEWADPASRPLGNLTGCFIESTHDYGNTYLTPAVLVLSDTSSACNPLLRGLHGTLSMIGITSNTVVQPQPITGGTGSFAFVMGSFTLAPVDVSTYTEILRLDLDLYWPPYSF